MVTRPSDWPSHKAASPAFATRRATMWAGHRQGASATRWRRRRVTLLLMEAVLASHPMPYRETDRQKLKGRSTWERRWMYMQHVHVHATCVRRSLTNHLIEENASPSMLRDGRDRRVPQQPLRYVPQLLWVLLMMVICQPSSGHAIVITAQICFGWCEKTPLDRYWLVL